jgi:peptide/nickel transport system substrate-binding protein
LLLGIVAAGALVFALGTRFGVIGGPDFREALVVGSRPLSLDPLIGADDRAVHDIGHLLYRSLLRLDTRAYPTGDLATAYTVSNDGLKYRVLLAAGQRWSDGHPITPDDVVATVAFAQSSRAVDHRVTAALQGVHVSEEGYTLVFTLPAPLASFEATLTQLPILPLGGLSASRLDSVTSQPSQAMATSGPYRVTSAGTSIIELEPNSNAVTRPQMSRYELHLYSTFDEARAAFAHGDVDALMTNTASQRAQLLKTKGAVAHDATTFRFVDLLFNERIPGLDDPVVRHAIAEAVDRTGIVRGALEGTGGIAQADAVSQGLPWIAGPAAAPAPTVAAANAALDADGWKPGLAGIRARNGVDLSFAITAPNADPLPPVARELAAGLNKIGIGLYVNLVPPQTFVASSLTPHAFQVAIADWDAGPDPDVTTFWRSNAVPPQGFNVSGAPADPFLDRALDSLATMTDAQARIHAAADVSRFLAADAPAVFLYTPVESFVTRVPLTGATISRAGGSAARYDTIASWRRG